MRAGTVIASAQKPSPFTHTFEIEVDGRKLQLHSASMFGRTFQVQEHADVVAQLRRNIWSTRTTVSADISPGFPAIAWCVWLVEIVRRREHAATAAG